jgi:RNA recognition motif-containing protein
MSKLFIGNLPYDATSDQLAQLFAQAGNVVDAVVITDRQSGRSKGFGFVEFSNPEEAQKAIQMFNGQDYQGRNLVVNEARPKQPKQY